MSINFTLILQIISFLILLTLLTKFLYKPFVKYLDKRTGDLKNLIEGTEADRKTAEENLQFSKNELHKAKEQSLQLKETAAREADKEKIKTLDEAKKEAIEILSKAERDIKKEIEKAKTDATKDIASLSVTLAKKILEREISEKDHKRLIEESLKEIIREK